METSAITATSAINSQSITQPAAIVRLPGEVLTHLLTIGGLSLEDLAGRIAPVCRDWYAQVDGLRSLAGSRLGVEIPEEAENWRSWLGQFRRLSFPNAPTRVFSGPQLPYRVSKRPFSIVFGTEYFFVVRQVRGPGDYGARISGSIFNIDPAGCGLSIFKRDDNGHVALPPQLLNQLALIDNKGVVNLRVVGDSVYVIANRDWEASSQRWKPRVSELPTGSILRLDIENGRLETVVGAISLPPALAPPSSFQTADTVWQLPHEVNKQGQLTYLAHDEDGTHSVYVIDLVNPGEPQLLGTIEGATEIRHILHVQDRLLVITNHALLAWKLSDGTAESIYERAIGGTGPCVNDVKFITTGNGKNLVAWTQSDQSRVRLFNFETGREIASHQVSAWQVQGDYLVAVGGVVTLDAHDLRLHVWNLATNERSPILQKSLSRAIFRGMTTYGPLAICNLASGRDQQRRPVGNHLEIINFLTGEHLPGVNPWPVNFSTPLLKGTTAYAVDRQRESLYRLSGNVGEQVIAQPLSDIAPSDSSPEPNGPPVDTPEASVPQHPWCSKLMVAALVIGALALTYSVMRVGRQKVFATT